jgi:uncharacterized membrane protein YfcA
MPDWLTEFPLYVALILGLVSFIAGFIDAVVGGGGLIQIPALLIGMPDRPIATLFGTNKIAAFSGTSVSAFQYARRIHFNWRILGVVSLCAFVCSWCGAKLVSYLDPAILKPVILFILIGIAIYLFSKKNIGITQRVAHSVAKQCVIGGGIGAVVGFYDGFFGPGTGSFLMLGFITLLGFEFLTASAYAKVINCITNISALSVFISQGHYLLGIGLIMALFNIAGNLLGSRTALKKGNAFVRKIFLFVVVLLIIRYGYDVLYPYFLTN